MARVFLIALQAAALALPGLAVGVHAVPFTPQGLAGTPSRLQAGLFILSKMPFDGLPFLELLGTLVWIPVITAAAALFQNAPPLRPLRWLGVAVNLAALGYMLKYFPGIFSADRLPVVLFGTAGLFCLNAVLCYLLPPRFDKKGARHGTVFLLSVFYLASLAILVQRGLRQPMPPLAWFGFAGCIIGFAGSWYCLVQAVGVSGAKKSGGAAGYLLAATAVFVAFGFLSPPLALPAAGGLLIFVAGALP